MIDTYWSVAAAGVATGLGVAMPLGAISLLLLTEGARHGRRPALAAACAIALVDMLYCAGAVFAGSVLAPVIESWSLWPSLVSGAAVLALGVRQLWTLRRSAAASPHTSDAHAGQPSRSAVSAFRTFVLLTAINPVTLVYFFALAGTLAPAASGPAGPAVFVAGVTLASLVWQIAVALIGVAVGKAFSQRLTRMLTVLASFLVLGLGVAVIVRAVST